MTILIPPGLYAGVNGRIIRAAATKLAAIQSASLYDLAVVLGDSCAAVKPAWDRLVAEGYIEGSEEQARPTPKMNELVRARIGKPLSRKKADALIADLPYSLTDTAHCRALSIKSVLPTILALLCYEIEIALSVQAQRFLGFFLHLTRRDFLCEHSSSLHFRLCACDGGFQSSFFLRPFSVSHCPISSIIFLLMGRS